MARPLHLHLHLPHTAPPHLEVLGVLRVVVVLPAGGRGRGGGGSRGEWETMLGPGRGGERGEVCMYSVAGWVESRVNQRMLGWTRSTYTVALPA